MTDSHVPLEVWADEGRRTAPSFADVAAAVVVGRDPEATAAVALGIARAVCADGQRRVAVADLIGGVPALSPLDDQPGLLECLRDGLPVSDIGQSLADAPDVYLLPSGSGPIAERWVFESGRWDRLVNGFREVDALLLLVAQAGAPGLETLIARVDGVVAVDLPPAMLRAWPLIATVDHPEPELPPITSKATPAAGTAPVAGASVGRVGDRRPRRVGRWILAAVLLLAVLGYGLQGRWQAWWEARRAAAADTPAGVPDSLALALPDSLAPADTLPLPDSAVSEAATGEIVNPGDSLIALRFSVELVAANSLAGANSTLVPRGDPYPVPTVAPVVLGSAPSVWYRAVVGAWATTQEAELWLARQRSLGLLRAGVGRVLHAPYALLLFEGPREEALLQSTRLEAEDVRVYVLETDDGRVRLFAGAFETANQALWFAEQLRQRGYAPQLAYRTGRAF